MVFETYRPDDPEAFANRHREKMNKQRSDAPSATQVNALPGGSPSLDLEALGLVDLHDLSTENFVHLEEQLMRDIENAH